MTLLYYTGLAYFYVEILSTNTEDLDLYCLQLPTFWYLSKGRSPQAPRRRRRETTAAVGRAVELAGPLGHLRHDVLLGLLDVRVDGVADAQVVAVAGPRDQDAGHVRGGGQGPAGAELAGDGGGPPRVELAVHEEQPRLGVQVLGQPPALGVRVDVAGRLAQPARVRVVALPGEEELALPLPVVGAG